MEFIPALEIGIWNAWIFMSVFILQMLAIAFINKRVWERSHIPKEVKRNRLERSAGIVGNLVWLITMGYSVFLPFHLNTLWFYFGLSVFIIGLIFMTIATYHFITAPTDRVITKGVYRLSRHPMYIATFLICLGSGIATISWVFLLLSIVMALCFYQEALIEERFCLEKYGDVYQKYMNRVPRCLGIPRKIA